MSEPLTVGSLFAGIGGIDLGLEMTGCFRTAWQLEIDDYARRVLAKHWPGIPRWRDIRTFLPDTASERRGSWGPGRVAAHRERRSHSPWVSRWRVDVVAAGFPCQDISYAGLGAGLHGKRSGLWWEAARVIRTLRPRYVLLENVAALLTRGLDAVLGTLASLGYDAEWHCLPAAHVGAPHIRDRVFVLGYADGGRTDAFASAGRPRGSTRQPGREPGHVANAECSRRDGIHERQRQGHLEAHAVERGPDITDGPASADHGRGIQGQGPQGGDDPAYPDGSRQRQQGGALAEFRRRAGTHWSADPADDPESGVGRMAHGIPSRVDRLRGLGNAVVPQVAEFIGRRLIEFHQALEATDAE